MTISDISCEVCTRANSAPLLKGRVANPGCVSGPVALIHQPATSASTPSNVILVTSMTDPDCVPAMERALAIITDRGGVLCHAAIVAREIDKPCIVGTGNATQTLIQGQVVRVCANRGLVFAE